MGIKRAPCTQTAIASLLSAHNPDIRAIVERLRAIVRETVPEASETPQPSWHSINYRHPDCGYFCGIFPQQDDVLIAFEFGVLLPDPDGVLEGKGTQVRFLRIKDARAIKTRTIKYFIREALALPEKHAVKLELLRAKAKPVRK
jgi:hypothetical protein